MKTPKGFGFLDASLLAEFDIVTSFAYVLPRDKPQHASTTYTMSETNIAWPDDNASL